MTPTQINKGIRQILGSKGYPTWTDRRSDHLRSKFMFPKATERKANIKQKQVQAFLKKKRIKSKVETFLYLGPRGDEGWTIVVRRY